MDTALYELKGESLAAAKSFEEILRIAVEKSKPTNYGTMGDIQKSWQTFYAGLIEDISNSEPELLDKIGINAHSIQITQAKDALARAYKKYPQIFLSPNAEPRYFMYAPIDYKDGHFIPEDAVRISGKDVGTIGDLLFAGGWLGNAPLISRDERGVPLPDDYKQPPQGSSLSDEFKYRRATATYTAFAPRGRSLEIVADYLSRKATSEAMSKDMFDSIRDACAEVFPEMKDENADLYVNLMGSYGSASRPAGFSFSLRRRSLGGEQVPMSETPYFNFEKKDGDYHIKPRLDTEQGSAFAAKLVALMPEPSLGDYKELHADYKFDATDIEKMVGVNGSIPQLKPLGGLNLLVYNSDDAIKSDFCPPDAKRVTTALFHWLQADEGDRNMGRTPPPMPRIILDELATISPASKPRYLKGPEL